MVVKVRSKPKNTGVSSSAVIVGAFWGTCLFAIVNTAVTYYRGITPFPSDAGWEHLVPHEWANAPTKMEKVNTKSTPSSSSTSSIPAIVNTPAKIEKVNTKSTTSSSSKRRQPPDPSRKRVKFPKFDEAAPFITNARTHFLKSIPYRNRVALDIERADVAKALLENDIYQYYEIVNKTYVSDPENVYPKKFPLYEFNPCIAILPKHYREREEWRRYFGEDKLPYYVATYRIAHYSNCWNQDLNLALMGGVWKHFRDEKSDFLGVSLMDENLNILIDTSVKLGPITSIGSRKSFSKYDDFRVYNLGEQLYLSSVIYLSPIDLSLRMLTSPNTTMDIPYKPKNFREIPRAFQDATSSSLESPNDTSLKVWVRKFSSCPVANSDFRRKNEKDPTKRMPNKNFLYFNWQGNVTGSKTAQTLFYPSANPQEVREVDLERGCNITPRPYAVQKLEIDYGETAKEKDQPKVAFENVDAKIFRRRRDHKGMFLEDRGSACCATIKANSVRSRIFNSTGINDDEELLVAVVHPKTKFPGKSLPKGDEEVRPNTYLSRFIAFLPREPYTIVAKSGKFCLGYPERGMDEVEGSTRSHPLEFLHMDPLSYGGVAHECPRIHFVMGIIDARPPEDGKMSDSVIVSYGVSDCLARFVEIPKSEIIRMFKPDDDA